MNYKGLVVLVSFAALAMAGCPKEQKMSTDEVIGAVVAAMCKKMTKCQPDAMPSEDFCQNTMKTAFQGNLDLTKIATSKKNLDGCVASIEKTECEGLLGSKPPAGCEFLE